MGRLILACIISATCAQTSLAIEFQRISRSDERLSFKHLAMNTRGDFVAVSRTKVFVGNTSEGEVHEIFQDTSLSFSPTSNRTLNFGEQSGRLEGEYLQTRLALNEAGLFVVASNRNLFYGSVQERTVRAIFEAERFTDFQVVAINDQGHIVALSNEMIVVGNHQAGTAKVLKSEVPGIFRIYEDYSFSNTAGVRAGLKPLALNASGRFAAASSSAVFVGSVPSERVEMFVEERFADYHHVQLNGDGNFTVASAEEVFVGHIDF